MWVRREFQDARGSEEIQVRSLQRNPHLENLENQGAVDSGDIKDSKVFQVPDNSVCLLVLYTCRYLQGQTAHINSRYGMCHCPSLFFFSII